jgi:DNA mismatch repair ATPase MutS
MFWRKKKRLRILRRYWGKALDKHRNVDLISSYYNLLKKENDDNYVDEKTWNDLNFNSIFSKLDRNITGIGQQYLYYLLHKYEQDEEILKKRFELISYFKQKSELRENIQLKLLNLNGVSSYFISSLALSKTLPNFKYYRLFYLLSIGSLLSILLITYNGVFLLITIGILLLNLIINKVFSSKIYEYFAGFSGLNNLISTSISLSELKTDLNIDEFELLKSKKTLLKSLKSKLGYLVLDKQHLNEFALLFIEYLNMFMLFDIIAYYRSVNVLLKNQDEIHNVFKTIANLDASISIASYLTETEIYSKPVFNDNGSINFNNVYHPLIKDAVPNTVSDIKNSVLITGSNMAGKTTFIKTLGINFILAQTLYFSLSESLNIPRYIVKTSIRRNEELEEGKSYFFVEIEALKNFIELTNNKSKYLFLIDEIFRGTNTIERLASSTAVLKFLDASNKVFVTTHDIELQELLQNNFLMYHFSEQVENEKFYFNYKIQHGASTSGNAIKLLELMSYPESITTEAYKLVIDINQKY